MNAMCTDCMTIFDGDAHADCPGDGCPARGSQWVEQEQGNDGEKKYTVRYYNPIMGVYETHWDTQEEAEKEAAYDHGMNGAPTRVLDPDGNVIVTFKEGQRNDV